jgi:hypothetical protein
MLKHRADVIEALINSAADPDYKSHQDRKLFLEITGDYISSSKLDAALRHSTGESQIDDREGQLIDEILNPRLDGQHDR